MRESDDETAVEDIDEAQDTDLESAVEDVDEDFPFPGLPGLPFPFPFSFGQQRRAPSVARGRGYYSQPPTAYFATQQQVRSLASKIQTDMSRNASAIQTVSRRVDAVQTAAARQNREIVRQGRTIAIQSRQIKANKNAIRQANEMNLMMFLLTQPTATDPTSTAQHFGGVNVPVGSRLLTQTGTGSDLLLPLLLFGGLGGEASGWGSGSGSNETASGLFSNPLMLIILIKYLNLGGI